MQKTQKAFHNITLSGLIILVIGTFTSVSFSALSHVLLFLSGFYFFFQYLRVKDFKIKKSWWALLGLCLSIVASLLVNWSSINELFRNLLKVKYFLISLLSCFSFYYFKRDFLKEKHYKWVLNLFLLATTIATLSGLIGLLSGFNPLKMKEACHATRACGLYGMYMTYGYGISLFSVLMVIGLQYKHIIFRYTSSLFFYTCLIINLVGLYFSYARGAWLGFIFALPFFFLKKYKMKFVIVAILGALLLLMSIALIPKARDMFFNRSISNQKRIAFFKAARHAWIEKPLLGWGYRNFEPNVVKIKQKNNLEFPTVGGHAHNNFLEHLASTGLIGACCFILFVYFWLKEQYLYGHMFPFIISFIISGLFQYTFGDGENLFLLMGVYSFFY